MVAGQSAHDTLAAGPTRLALRRVLGSNRNANDAPAILLSHDKAFCLEAVLRFNQDNEAEPTSGDLSHRTPRGKSIGDRE